jgi:hypothetical protein
MPVVIETEEENARMLAIVEKLMKKGEDLSVSKTSSRNITNLQKPNPWRFCIT